VNTLPSTQFVDIVEIETLNMALKQGFTLLKLALYALGITSGSEGLPVPVLLMAWGASIGTSSTSRVLGIALETKIKSYRVSELRARWRLPSVSPERRHLPAHTLIFLLLHRAHAS
jgi:hypothetical protein